MNKNSFYFLDEATTSHARPVTEAPSNADGRSIVVILSDETTFDVLFAHWHKVDQ